MKLFGKKKEKETETDDFTGFLNELGELYAKKEITKGEYIQIRLLSKLVSMVEKALS